MKLVYLIVSICVFSMALPGSAAALELTFDNQTDASWYYSFESEKDHGRAGLVKPYKKIKSDAILGVSIKKVSITRENPEPGCQSCPKTNHCLYQSEPAKKGDQIQVSINRYEIVIMDRWGLVLKSCQ